MLRVSKEAQETRVKQTKMETEIYDLWEKYDLSPVEVLQVLNSFEAMVLKYELRRERHGDYEKPAMEE